MLKLKNKKGIIYEILQEMWFILIVGNKKDGSTILHRKDGSINFKSFMIYLVKLNKF
jgi:hypothetical protein